jgi:hypothetical protein
MRKKTRNKSKSNNHEYKSVKKKLPITSVIKLTRINLIKIRRKNKENG